MTDNLKEFSLAEVEKHNTIGSCWIVLDGKVYDVSKFLDEHPGGLEVIAELAGKDATASFEDVGHSKDARDMAKEYLIGTFVQVTACFSAKSKLALRPRPLQLRKRKLLAVDICVVSELREID
ncbi:cytochrome b5-like Heme/Steroid binding domain protein [Ancylostoma duodenale]|uniref:Cytochrome b5-like Heme/Steroid binding domain protein n=1 Tax=Ancylostoma duodenale TaxID=51022 RepID=A0A0C2GPY0_9BILA|nr:cytochrome b5-like Heme/Steroid binding domain protein [Ancylostoma duodenale]